MEQGIRRGRWLPGSRGLDVSQWHSVSQSVSDKPLCVSLTSCQLRITAGWRLLWAVANKRRTWCKQSHHSRLCVCLCVCTCTKRTTVYMFPFVDLIIVITVCVIQQRKMKKKNLFTEEITWTWLLFHFKSGNYVGNPHNWDTWVVYWCQYMLCTVQYTYSSHYRGGVEPTT